MGCLAGFRVYGLGLVLLLRLTGRVLRALEEFLAVGPVGLLGLGCCCFLLC